MTLQVREGFSVEATESLFNIARGTNNRADINKVARLIKEGADVNARNEAGYTPLHYIAEMGKIDLLKYLTQIPRIEIDAQNSEGKTPLFYAMLNLELESVDHLVKDAKADINLECQDGDTLACKLMEHQHVAVKLDHFVELGLNINKERSSDGKTPLHLATDERMVAALIKAGADVDKKCASGKTPFFCYFEDLKRSGGESYK